MKNRSRKAAHYGRLVEEAARRRYNLDPEHSYWYDARTSDGRPVETKGAMVNRRDGKTGRFRVFEEPHKKLVRADGLYVFIPYRAAGRGINVLDARSVEASKLRFDWSESGGHRDSRQAKVPVSRLF